MAGWARLCRYAAPECPLNQGDRHLARHNPEVGISPEVVGVSGDFAAPLLAGGFHLPERLGTFDAVERLRRHGDLQDVLSGAAVQQDAGGESVNHGCKRDIRTLD